MLVRPEEILLDVGEVTKRADYFTKVWAEFGQVSDYPQKTTGSCLVLRLRYVKNSSNYLCAWFESLRSEDVTHERCF